MTDISKCNNEKCKDKNTCYRYKAAPGIMQSYIWWREDSVPTERCDKYWHLESEQL